MHTTSILLQIRYLILLLLGYLLAAFHEVADPNEQLVPQAMYVGILGLAGMVMGRNRKYIAAI